MLFICFSDLNIILGYVGGFIFLGKNIYLYVKSYKLHITKFQKVPSLRFSSAQGHTKLGSLSKVLSSGMAARLSTEVFLT